MSPLSPFDTVCAARFAVYKKLPYFMKMLFKLTPVERPGCGTFIVDNRLRVHYDPAKVAEWGVDLCATFLAHEVQHPLREHVARFLAFEDRNRLRYESLRPALAKVHPLLGTSLAAFWNVVADIEINPSVREVGFTFPDGFSPFYPETLALEGRRVAEEYAEELFARAEKEKEEESKPKSDPSPKRDGEKSEPSDGSSGESDGDDEDESDDSTDGEKSEPSDEPSEEKEEKKDEGKSDEEGAPDSHVGSGSCGGCCGNRTEVEESLDEEEAPRGVDVAEVEIARRQVAHDTAEPTEEMRRLMSQYGIGKVPGSLADWAKAQLVAPEVPWQKVLAPLVRSAVAYARGRVDWKFGRPSRRRAAMVQFVGDEAPLLPTLESPIPNVGIVVDTSGSMNAKGTSARTILEDALSEVVGIVLATGSPTWAAAVDADVQGWTKIASKTDAQKLVKGGGGTDMRVGIAAAEKRGFDVIVLVTDGYTPWPSRASLPKKARLVVCVIGRAEVPSYLRVVRVVGKEKVR